MSDPATVTTAALTGTVRAERRGDIGVVTLDRVKALNALTTEMVDTLAQFNFPTAR